MENNLVKKFEEAMPTTKEQVTDIAFDLIEKLDNGEISGLELLRNFKMIEKIQEQVKEAMMRAALKEADQHPEKEIEKFGVTYTKMEAGTKYDYSKCNDPQHAIIMENVKKWDDEKKTREAFLRSIKDKHEDVDTDSGEVLRTFYAPVKTSTSTLQVKIK